MILKGSQRAGATALAGHLLNERDNDHVRLHELRGFVADDLRGALSEAHAISKGTQCKQFLFSLSLNPPKGVSASEADFERAADEAEKRLGLEGQPRAIVIHEKEGRRHAHVVWSRIDADTMRAINLPHFKNKLTALSRELYLEHGWTLPDGLRSHGGKSPLNFTLAEWQQAKRLDRDPREIKDVFQDAWARSDNVAALGNALAERGYFLARGDRRGFVATDINGEVYALAKWVGVKTSDVRHKLGTPDALPPVDQVQREVAGRVTDKLTKFISDVDTRHAQETAPLRARLDAMREQQGAERARLKAQQDARWRSETDARAARLRTGFAGVWDRLSGKAKAIRTQNEAEAFEGLRRDRMQRDDLAGLQLSERLKLQRPIEELRQRHAQNRRLLASEISAFMRRAQREQDHAAVTDTRTRTAQDHVPPPGSRTPRGFSLDH
ncbi:MAG: relaxase/mobilization nuclease domain-containing protein [Sphingomonadaceae bacterium]